VNPDVSVAPEIAQLMERPGPAGDRPVTSPARRPTVGDLARELRQLTGTPDRWWSLVRFDAERPVRVPIPAAGPYQAWLSILPPAASDDQLCACDVVTVMAGELTEHVEPTGHGRPAVLKPLVPGRIRVHGAHQSGAAGPHHAVNTSDGYTVSVQLRAFPASRVSSSDRCIPESPHGPMPA
jgi:hypothetical protein